MGSPAAPAESWRDDAACIGADPRIFTDPQPDTDDVRRAVEICHACPVKQPCLDTAMKIEASADVGIWGGTTPHARSRLRRTHADTVPTPQAARAAVPSAHRDLARSDDTCDRLQLHVDGNGDYIDQTGRVIVFELHGQPPYMLMIDGKPRARTATVDDATGLADRFLSHNRAPLESHPQTGMPEPAPSGGQRRRA